MIRSEYHTENTTGLGGSGKGTAKMERWLDGEELTPNLSMIATITLPVGGSVSLHTHEGEAEVYRIQSGTGLYTDNGREVTVGPGYTTLCRDGEQHGLENTGTEPLVFDAIIVGGQETD